MQSIEPLLDIKEAAAILKIHEKTLARMARAGQVPAFKLGDLWRFRATNLDTWLKQKLSSGPALATTSA